MRAEGPRFDDFGSLGGDDALEVGDGEVGCEKIFVKAANGSRPFATSSPGSKSSITSPAKARRTQPVCSARCAGHGARIESQENSGAAKQGWGRIGIILRPNGA
jgi:hypothetical protein